MDTSRERDRSIERLLRQSLQPPRNRTGSCLDAETLAAWVDGGLSGAALEVAQAHVADCARCQSLVGAMARTTRDALPEPRRRQWLAWLVPLSAAAAAVTLWVAVPRDSSPPAPPSQISEAQRGAVESKAPEAAPLAAEPLTPLARTEQATPPSLDAGTRQAPELRRDVGQIQGETEKQEADALVFAERLPAAAPPAPGTTRESIASGRSANVLADAVNPRIEVAAPDPSIRWRIAGSAVERTTDGGSSWAAVPSGVTTPLVAGVAPATSIFWVVGRAGVVLLSTDGRSLRRVAFPEITDLSSIAAIDERSATVSTADGRLFSTSNGGATWAPR